jgi:hypothetical protein
MSVAAAASGIASARKKLARATEHIAALRAAIDDYRSSSPPTFGVQAIGNQAGMSTIHVAVSVTEAVPIPDSWALITGDILTNLHAALDHSIYPHGKCRKPVPPDFANPVPDPRRRDGVPFETIRHRSPLRHPGSAELRSSQPFQHANKARHRLALLRELVNADKHRKLLIVESLPEDWTLRADPRLAVADLTFHRDTAMTTGAMICEARLGSDRRSRTH